MNPRMKSMALPPSGSSAPCARPWKSAKAPTRAALAVRGRLTCAASNSPNTSSDAMIMGSTAGSASPIIPASAPINRRHAKLTGVDSARDNVGWVVAAHMPTANMARRWSTPVSGCSQPAASIPAAVSWRCPGWAKALPLISVRSKPATDVRRRVAGGVGEVMETPNESFTEMGGRLNDGVVHGHELGAVGECGLHLDVGDHLGHPFHDVVSRQQRGSVVHEFGNAASVASAFQDSGGDQGDGFWVVQLQATRLASFGKQG